MSYGHYGMRLHEIRVVTCDFSFNFQLQSASNEKYVCSPGGQTIRLLSIVLPQPKISFISAAPTPMLQQANPGDLVAATWKQSSAFAEQSR